MIANTLVSGRAKTEIGLRIALEARANHVVALFAAVVALSILAPGRRATRINPPQALQHE